MHCRLITAIGLLLAIFLNLSCVTAPPAPQVETHSRINLIPCQFPNYKSALLCGKYDVYENRAAMSGRMIGLNILVAPASSNSPRPDPIFFLAGGPGQGQARMASAGEDALMRALRRDRDLVFVDQRGTGDSHSLQCNLNAPRNDGQSYFAELFLPEQVRACQKILAEKADLRYYTTSLAVDDLEEIRAALQYEKINFYGVSYGTVTALEYLRRYPKRVRSLALAGVSPPAAKLPLQFAQGTERAMTRLLSDCNADPGCNAAYGNFRKDLAAVLARLDGGPVVFDFPNPRSKVTEPVSLSRNVFVEQLRLMLYNHESMRLIPLMVHAAAQEDWSVFAKIKSQSRGNATFAATTGVYFTITCSESVPYITEAEIAHRTAGTILGEYRTRRHQRACEEWPRAALPEDYFEPVKSALPVLMLSGDIDPSTPMELAEAASKFLPNAKQIILRNTPHSYGSDCAQKLILEFIASGSAQELDASCAARLRRPPFLTELPARYNR
jgi:pimeloyl-ACP methyl ester carboxylesterase